FNFPRIATSTRPYSKTVFYARPARTISSFNLFDGHPHRSSNRSGLSGNYCKMGDVALAAARCSALCDLHAGPTGAYGNRVQGSAFSFSAINRELLNNAAGSGVTATDIAKRPRH